MPLPVYFQTIPEKKSAQQNSNRQRNNYKSEPGWPELSFTERIEVKGRLPDFSIAGVFRLLRDFHIVSRRGMIRVFLPHQNPSRLPRLGRSGYFWLVHYRN